MFALTDSLKPIGKQLLSLIIEAIKHFKMAQAHVQQLFEEQTFVLIKNCMSDYDLINLKRKEDK
jgi:hypothetical protein